MLEVIALLGGVALLVYMRFIEPDWLETTQTDVPIPDLPPQFDGYRFVHISDIHMTRWMRQERLLRIVQAVNAANGDAIVITGDFVTRLIPYKQEDLIAGLCQLSAPDGVYAVPGNHDHAAGIAPVRQALQHSNIIDLSNCHYPIQRNGARILLAGLDDITQRQGRIDDVLAHLDEHTPAILLAHEPDIADFIAPLGRFALQLSGHTHGGQIVLPLIGSPYKPRHGRLYRAGLYNIGGLQLYVTRGVGAVLFPLRFRCRPEISVLTLRVVPK